MKQLHLSSQLPLSLGSQLSTGSLSVVFASDAPGLPVTITNDTNYGTPGSNTLRTAAMLGIGSTAVSNANPIPVSDAGGSLTIDGTVAVSSSALPTGASTEATLSALSAKLPSALGSNLSADSLSVVFASDGTLPLPADAATETTSLVIASRAFDIVSNTSTIATRLPTAIGQTTASASLAVVLASDQTLPLPSGAATESTLSAISGKLPASLGQKASASSLAVVLASDQSSIPVSQSGTWNLTNVSGTVSLPTGAATETTVATTATNTTTSNVAYTAKGKIAGASLTGSYATLLDPSSDLRMIYLFNTCDQTIFVSLDGGTVDTFELEPAESVSIDLTASRLKFPNTVNISAKHAGVVPTSGSIRCTGIG